MQTLLPPAVLHSLPAAAQATLLGKSFFPNLISSPFMDGMRLAFYLAAVVCLLAAVSSLVREQGGRPAVEFMDSGSDIEGQEEGLPARAQ